MTLNPKSNSKRPSKRNGARDSKQARTVRGIFKYWFDGLASQMAAEHPDLRREVQKLANEKRAAEQTKAGRESLPSKGTVHAALFKDESNPNESTRESLFRCINEQTGIDVSKLRDGFERRLMIGPTDYWRAPPWINKKLYRPSFIKGLDHELPGYYIIYRYAATNPNALRREPLLICPQEGQTFRTLAAVREVDGSVEQPRIFEGHAHVFSAILSLHDIGPHRDNGYVVRHFMVELHNPFPLQNERCFMGLVLRPGGRGPYVVAMACLLSAQHGFSDIPSTDYHDFLRDRLRNLDQNNPHWVPDNFNLRHVDEILRKRIRLNNQQTFIESMAGWFDPTLGSHTSP